MKKRKEFTRSMLVACVGKYNRINITELSMKWDYQKNHGYNIWLGALDVYDGLSLRSAVKAVQMAITVADGTHAQLNYMQRGNVKFWRDQVTTLQRKIGAVKEEVEAVRKRLKVPDANKVPTTIEILRKLSTPVKEGYNTTAIRWAYTIAEVSLNNMTKDFVEVHPFDTELFKTIFTMIGKKGTQGVTDMGFQFADQLKAVLLDRYVETIRVAMVLKPKPVAVPNPNGIFACKIPGCHLEVGPPPGQPGGA